MSEAPPNPLLPLGLDHYWNTDFSTTLKVFQTLMVTEPTPRNVAQFNIYQDHASNTKFIGFYIPASEDTYPLCASFTESYEGLMNELGKSVIISAQSAGDLVFTEAKDLTFSRRVYIYHETELSLEQLGHLSALFRAKNLHVQFRGRNYASTRWLQDKVSEMHSTPSAPPAKNKRVTSNKEKPDSRKTGPSPTKTLEATKGLLEDLRSGKRTMDSLQKEKQQSIADDYDISRETAVKARDQAIAEYQQSLEKA